MIAASVGTGGTRTLTTRYTDCKPDWWQIGWYDGWAGTFEHEPLNGANWDDYAAGHYRGRQDRQEERADGRD